MKTPLEDALNRADGVLRRVDVPELRSQLDWAVRRGELVPLLAGIYARPEDAGLLSIKARAVCLADPDAIVCAQAAAALHGWLPAEQVTTLVAATRRLHTNDWLTTTRRGVPRQLIRRIGAVRCTSRALTAVDLIPEVGADIVDEALRRRVRLEDMVTALTMTPGRRGNAERQLVLADSRDTPWSHAERVAHRALHRARIRGWKANHQVIADPNDPPVAVLDVGFVALKLDIEIDGGQHDDPAGVRRDRFRDERLALLGWQVVRFSARRVLADPDGFADAVMRLAQIRARQLGKTLI